MRWYPPEWRARYGDELAACIDDELDGRRPGARMRLSVAAAGLRQRVRSAGLAGDGTTPEARLRAGALVVFASWAGLLIGAMAFLKAAEHFSVAAVLSHGHGLSVAAFDAFRVLALAGAVSVAAGAAVALPATVRHLRSGGWELSRRSILAALGLTGATGLATVVLAQWAHHLTYHQRNGGLVGYGIAFACWGLLLVATVATWTGAGIGVARRIELDRGVLRVEGWLAVAVAAVVAGSAIATAVWWSAMADGASWFLAGTRPGTQPSGVTVQLAIIESWLVVTTVVALCGAARVTRALRSA